jgi:hypothetical protein
VRVSVFIIQTAVMGKVTKTKTTKTSKIELKAHRAQKKQKKLQKEIKRLTRRAEELRLLSRSLEAPRIKNLVRKQHIKFANERGMFVQKKKKSRQLLDSRIYRIQKKEKKTKEMIVDETPSYPKNLLLLPEEVILTIANFSESITDIASLLLTNFAFSTFFSNSQSFQCHVEQRVKHFGDVVRAHPKYIDAKESIKLQFEYNMTHKKDKLELLVFIEDLITMTSYTKNRSYDSKDLLKEFMIESSPYEWILDDGAKCYFRRDFVPLTTVIKNRMINDGIVVVTPKALSTSQFLGFTCDRLENVSFRIADENTSIFNAYVNTKKKIVRLPTYLDNVLYKDFHLVRFKLKSDCLSSVKKLLPSVASLKRLCHREMYNKHGFETDYERCFRLLGSCLDKNQPSLSQTIVID